MDSIPRPQGQDLRALPTELGELLVNGMGTSLSSHSRSLPLPPRLTYSQKLQAGNPNRDRHPHPSAHPDHYPSSYFDPDPYTDLHRY